MSPVQRYLTVAIIFLLKFTFQDPLEQYFSQQHHRGDSKDNPTVNEYFENVATLHVRQHLAIECKTMNISPEKASD